MSLEVIHPDWPAPAGIRAFTTTRRGGVSDSHWGSMNLGASCGDNPENVLKNREILRRMLPSSPIWLSQVHGTRAIIGPTEAAPLPKADAAITTHAGTVCAVLTADCLPVLLTNTKGTEVAAAHAGWRGLAAGVLESTIGQMASEPAGMIAWIGPGIGADAYEVGAEVRQAFCAADPDAQGAFKVSRTRWKADLPMLAKQRLLRAGIAKVYGGTQCTFENRELFFSYRRDGTTGRMATVIWIESAS